MSVAVFVIIAVALYDVVSVADVVVGDDFGVASVVVVLSRAPIRILRGPRLRHGSHGRLRKRRLSVLLAKVCKGLVDRGRLPLLESGYGVLLLIRMSAEVEDGLGLHGG